MVNVASPGIAAVTWKHEDRQIRVYFQKDDGFIYEAAWDEARWNSNHTQIVQAKPNTPLAAIVFMPWQPEIHIYYLDTSNVLQEYIYSTLKGGWEQGDTLPSPDLNPITTLAALTWARPTTQEIRVFYQKSDDTIQELVYSSSWSVGSSFTDKAYPGTSLSATTVEKDNITTIENPAYHVFWQAPTTLSLNEYVWSGTDWSTCEIKYTPPPALSGISAVGWMDKAGQSHINVFTEKEAGDGYFLWQMVTYGDKTGWTFFGFHQGHSSIKSQTPIAVVGWVGEEQEEYRMYAWTSGQNLTTSAIAVIRRQPLTAFPGVRESTTEVIQF